MKDVAIESKKIQSIDNKKERERKKAHSQKMLQIDHVKSKTVSDLNHNEEFIRKKIAYKEEEAIKDYNNKMTILKSNFIENISKLVVNIETQRDTVSGSYGPLVLDSKR